MQPIHVLFNYQFRQVHDICLFDLFSFSYFLTILFPTIINCWSTLEAGDIKQDLTNYMESASTESQNCYHHCPVLPCFKDSSLQPWLISCSLRRLWLTSSTDELWRRYTNLWLIDWLILFSVKSFSLCLSLYIVTTICGEQSLSKTKLIVTCQKAINFECVSQFYCLYL